MKKSTMESWEKIYTTTEKNSLNLKNQLKKNKALSENAFILCSNPKSVFYICGRAILTILTFGISEYLLKTIFSSSVVQSDLA